MNGNDSMKSERMASEEPLERSAVEISNASGDIVGESNVNDFEEYLIESDDDNEVVGVNDVEISAKEELFELDDDISEYNGSSIDGSKDEENLHESTGENKVDESDLMDMMLKAMKENEKDSSEIVGIELESCCDVASPSHSECQPIFLSQLLKGLTPIDSLATKKVLSIIELMIYPHICKFSTPAKARELTEKIIGSTKPFRTYYQLCKGLLTSILFSSEIVRAAYEMRLRTCKVAFSALKDSEFLPIRLRFDLSVSDDDAEKDSEEVDRSSSENMTEKEVNEWRLLFSRASLIVEDLRATTVHGCDHLVQASFVMIGDSDAKYMYRAAQRGLLIYAPSSTAAVTRVSQMAFASSVGHILVFVGGDDLRNDISTEDILNNVEQLANLLKKTGVKATFVAPPFNMNKMAAHGALLMGMWKLLNTSSDESNVQLALARGFRSLAEITRHGRVFHRQNVNDVGQLTRDGAIQTLFHLRCVYKVVIPELSSFIKRTVLNREPLVKPSFTTRDRSPSSRSSRDAPPSRGSSSSTYSSRARSSGYASRGGGSSSRGSGSSSRGRPFSRGGFSSHGSLLARPLSRFGSTSHGRSISPLRGPRIQPFLNGPVGPANPAPYNYGGGHGGMSYDGRMTGPYPGPAQYSNQGTYSGRGGVYSEYQHYSERDQYMGREKRGNHAGNSNYSGIEPKRMRY